MPSIHLLPFEVADGPHNMAADEVMLHRAAAGIASLRFYGWSAPTLSLGYFQPAAARLAEPQLAQLPWVRRPSGGATLVHDRETTYALAVPPGLPWQTGEPWLPRMHRIIAAGLRSLGIARNLSLVEKESLQGNGLCFQQLTPGDLECVGTKVAGSAQRRHRRCLLQHGGILLAQSSYTPQLPGLLELAGLSQSVERVAHAVAAAFEKETGWLVEPAPWTSQERLQIRALANAKYGSPTWNEKR
jgi:lipoyl(octanoyl) transferase